LRVTSAAVVRNVDSIEIRAGARLELPWPAGQRKPIAFHRFKQKFVSFDRAGIARIVLSSFEAVVLSRFVRGVGQT